MKKLQFIFMLLQTVNSYGQVNDSLKVRKTMHTFSVGHPLSWSHDTNVAISAHYEYGFKIRKRLVSEIQVSYVLNKFADTYWNFQLNKNSQMFSLQYGGRFYLIPQKHKVNVFIRGAIGLEFINYESGRNLLLPAFSGGIYTEILHKFLIGTSVEGLMPIAYLKLGYRLF